MEPVAYADDLLFVVEGGSEPEVEQRAQFCVSSAERWLRRRGLEVASQKTEILVVKGPRSSRSFEVHLLGEPVVANAHMKYLGVTISKNLNFSKHVEKMAALGRIMPNIGGPGYKKRRLYSGVVHSVLGYAMLAWRDALKTQRNIDRLVKVQRKSLLRVGSAYRTVSAEAVQVVVGFPTKWNHFKRS